MPKKQNRKLLDVVCNNVEITDHGMSVFKEMAQQAEKQADEKTFGQIAFETFQHNPTYTRLLERRTGYKFIPVPWDCLVPDEQQVWEEVAEAVIHDYLSTRT